MDKQRAKLEILAFRIVRRHFKNIVQNIPMGNLAKLTYPALIYNNVTISQIREMYKELYFKVGFPEYKRALKVINKQKDAQSLFEEFINKFLAELGGQRIVSVHSSFIESIMQVIAQGYEQNLSVADITRLLQNQFLWNKIQAQRIARTETTTITNAATVLAADNSKYQMEKVWISVQDSRTRRPPKSLFDHLDMNGTRVDYNRKFLVSGYEMEYPGDPKAPAGNVINCRCKIAVVAKVDEDGLPILKNKN
jgi:uncharacterized protein with gpF-like domain